MALLLYEGAITTEAVGIWADFWYRTGGECHVLLVISIDSSFTDGVITGETLVGGVAEADVVARVVCEVPFVRVVSGFE